MTQNQLLRRAGSSPALGTMNFKKVGNIMNIEIMTLENRISILRHRDPVGNAAIIKKLERKLRRLKG